MAEAQKPDTDLVHRRMYEDAIPMAKRMRPDAVLPPWDELTETQRANIRKANHEHMQFVNDLGAKIRNGDA